MSLAHIQEPNNQEQTMKHTTVKYEESIYKIKSMGFFTANRLLMNNVISLFPALLNASEEKKKRDETGETSKESLTELLSSVLEQLDADRFEAIVKTSLKGITKDGEAFDLDTIEDYGLLIDLLIASFKLNYSSLGKVLARLKTKLPQHLLSKLEEQGESMEAIQN